jgi:hypothetical protein
MQLPNPVQIISPGSATFFTEMKTYVAMLFMANRLQARDIDRNTTYVSLLGGPIIKNKLFFFITAKWLKRQQS